MTPSLHLADTSTQRVTKDVHVYGIISIVLELCLCLENFLPVLVVLYWKRPRERTVSDKLLASLSAVYIMSALIPTPLGLASYFHGSWYGGISTCECFQVTSTWCRLSALAIVSYLSVDLHLTACTHVPPDSVHAVSSVDAGRVRQEHSSDSTCRQDLPHPSSPSPCGCASTSSSTGKEFANIMLFFVFTVTLVIASLPVVGYGPEVMPVNFTCDSWLIDTPTAGKQRTYFVAFLTFGFFSLGVVFFGVLGTLLTLRSWNRWTRWEGQRRYTEESRINAPSLPSAVEQTSSRLCKMAGLIIVNQAMWIPALVTVTVQKLGYPVTDATMMYSILSTSLPGLLNPLLLGLLFRDYRLGYRYVLLRLCCFCPHNIDESNSLKNLRSRSRDSLNQVEDGELSITETVYDNNVTSAVKAYPIYACPEGAGSDDTTDYPDCNSYLVVEIPNEQTPLQTQGMASVAVSGRPIIASLYDEYGELSGAPKTELLSPCGSEECLLSAEHYKTQTESVV